MKILLTGATSFTGMWFAKCLADGGHTVVSALRNDPDQYVGMKAQRLQALAGAVQHVATGDFGSDRFIELIGTGDFDVLALHAAHVDNYRSLEFDALQAAQRNTHRIREVFSAFRQAGGRSVFCTGSVFEAHEGLGDAPLKAFSPYGLSKTLTYDIQSHWAGVFGLPVRKFVIANPFGPMEEPRFCAYLVDCWAKGEVAEVRTPHYVRDNIHVSLLAQCYRGFVESAGTSPTPMMKLAPSGYVESQAAFARRFADQLSARLRVDAELNILEQIDFNEPRMRVNRDGAGALVANWSEAAAWDAVCTFYAPRFKLGHAGPA